MKTCAIMIFSIVVGLAASNACIYAGTNAEADIKVALPPELFTPRITNSAGAITYANSRHKLLSKIPQATGGYGISTLGQLAKLCDAAVVGHVLEIKDVTATNRSCAFAHDYSLTVSAVSNLLAGQVASSLSLKYRQGPWKVDVKSGDDVIVFLSRDEFRFEWGSTAFDFVKKTSKQNRPLSIMGESRGVLVLRKPCGSNEVFHVVTKYIELLRMSQRNADTYYGFLKKTIRSQNERLKRDGNSDLLNFLRTCKSFDLNRVLFDDTIDDNVKNYVRLVLIHERKKQASE